MCTIIFVKSVFVLKLQPWHTFEWLLNVTHTNCIVLCCVVHSYLDIKQIEVACLCLLALHHVVCSLHLKPFIML